MNALASLLADAASEGSHVILGMLIVGCVFLLVITVGELSHWASRRRARR